MSIATYFMLLCVSIVLQLTIIPLFSVQGATPDIILIFVLALALQRGRLWAFPVGFAAGFLFDLFGTGLVGVSSLANSVAVFSVGFLREEQFEKRMSVIVGLLFLSIYFHDIVYFAILSLGLSSRFWNVFVKQAFPNTFYTLVFMVVIQLLMPNLFWGRNSTTL